MLVRLKQAIVARFLFIQASQIPFVYLRKRVEKEVKLQQWPRDRVFAVNTIKKRPAAETIRNSAASFRTCPETILIIDKTQSSAHFIAKEKLITPRNLIKFRTKLIIKLESTSICC